MPAAAEHLSHFSLVLDGKPADKDAMDALITCVVETTLNLPDLCVLRLHDTAFKWIDSTLFKEGVSLQVDVTWEGGETATLFRGEIVGLEMDLDAHHMPTISVRAYDRSHRLHRGRTSRTFVQMSDSDIVNKIGQEMGFSVNAKFTPIVHDWLMQNNQTNWEFLSECAVRCAFRLYMKGERDLYFEPIDYSSRQTPLEWGKDLVRFRPRISTAQQIDEVIVRGWDVQKKTPIIGKSQSAKGTPVAGGSPVQGGTIAHQTWGTARHHLVDHPVRSQNEADVLAQSLCDAIGNTFLEAEGTANGKATLQPGTWVEINNIGQRFSGKYFVTTARHVYGAPQKGGGGAGGGDGYQTTFQVTGKQPPILLSLISSRTSNGKGSGSATLGGNIVVGVVTDNNDPDGMGRVKVEYPWLVDGHTSHWARVVSPMAGKGRGFYFLPEIGDEVLVAFEHGAITHPYLLGALWNGKDSTIEPNSKAVSGGNVNRRTIKTRTGHTILLDDTDGKGGVEILTKDGRTVNLSDADSKITVSDKGGNSMVVNSSDSSIAIKCNGDFTVSAKGNVKIEGTGGVSVSSPAQTEVKGSAVNVNGSATVGIKGGMVNIN